MEAWEARIQNKISDVRIYGQRFTLKLKLTYRLFLRYNEAGFTLSRTSKDDFYAHLRMFYEKLNLQEKDTNRLWTEIKRLIPRLKRLKYVMSPITALKIG